MNNLTVNKLRQWARTNQQQIITALAARIVSADVAKKVTAYTKPVFEAYRAAHAEFAECSDIDDVYDAIFEDDNYDVVDAYYKALEVAHAANGFDMAPGCSPDLVAASQVSTAENVLARSLCDLVGIKYAALDLESHRRLVEIATSQAA